MANPIAKANSLAFNQINKVTNWWNLPLPLALLNLRALRDDLREYNLYDTEVHDAKQNGSSNGVSSAGLPKYRTYDGSQQDPVDPDMGKVGTRFGRNAPRDATKSETGDSFMSPSPREVSTNLLNRDTFKPAEGLNVLAGAWIQFENHDWFGHGENDPSRFIDVPLGEGDDWGAESGEDVMKIRATSPDRTHAPADGEAPTYINTVTHWWDGSQIYGSTEERNREMRTGEGGRMAMEDGRLLEETSAKLKGVDLTGFNDNYWVGLSLLHTLFTKEHNSIADYLRGHYPSWDDERLFLTARLVNSALMAKIHTVEWTPGILNNPVLHRGMHANWYGALPRFIVQNVRPHYGGLDGLFGIVGSPQDHGAAPYSITEEFASVYRLHPLIPDDYEIRDHATGKLITETDFDPLQGHGCRPSIDEWGMDNVLYSFGVANPGAITLHNHPKALQNHVRLNGDRVDLGSIDVLRDRERGVPRYNDFRDKLRKKRLTNFEQLSSNKVWVDEIEAIYDGDIDRVDLQVGMLAEDLPPGFGFSDTAFRIFILMASRRLKSDRFFTNDYSSDVYTLEGLHWVEKNGMKEVLLRHHPELAPALDGVKNAFAPWNKLG